MTDRRPTRTPSTGPPADGRRRSRPRGAAPSRAGERHGRGRHRAGPAALPPATRGRRPRSSASGTGMFGGDGRGRHLRLRRPGPHGRAAGAERAPVRRLVRRGRRRPRRGARRRRAPARTAAIENVVVDRGELTLSRPPRAPASRSAAALRDDPDLRFELCLGRQRRALPATTPAASCTPSTTCSRSPTTAGVRLEVTCPDADPHIPSVVEVYPTADWHERETWDFFGIVFDGHPALTRIQMPDDWPGHPQRKDYPLGGIPVEYKGAIDPPPDQRRSYRDRPHVDPTTTHRSVGDAGTRAASSPPPAATGPTSPRRRRASARSASSSTWARSTRRRTACSG